MAFVVAPNGATLVTAGRSSLLRVWDVSTSNVIKEFKGPRGLVNVMAFDGTGSLLATGGADRSVMVRASSCCACLVYTLLLSVLCICFGVLTLI